MAKNLTTGLQRGLRQSIAGGLGTGDLFSTASLDLQFARHKSLDSRVTHTRQSSATYVDGDGVIRTAVTNLLTYSEDGSQSNWTHNPGTITPDATLAPDNTLTADKIVINNGAGAGDAYLQAYTITANAVSTVSGYFKAEEFEAVQLGSSQGGNGFFAIYNLTTGVKISSGALGTGTLTDESVESVGNGWYRVSVSGTITAGATNGAWRITIKNSSGTTVTGDGTSGIFVWGAQAEQSSTVGQYVKTTSAINSAPRFDHDPTTGESLGLLVEESRTNLVTYSEDFSSGFSAQNSSIDVNQIVAPDGTSTADKFIPDDTANRHWIQFSLGSSLIQYTGSIYAKAGELSTITLRVGRATSPSEGAKIDLTDGSFIYQGTDIDSASVENAGNGWYRVIVTNTCTNAGTQYFAISHDDQDLTAGDGTSGIYIWGAQVEAGSFPTSYIPTEGSTVTRAADVTSITGTNFSSWYEQSEGTVFSDSLLALGNTASYAPGIISINNGTNQNEMLQFYSGNTQINTYVKAANVTVANVAGVPFASGLRAKAASRFKTNSVNGAVNGALGTEDTSVTIPTVTTLKIGQQATSATLNGTIRRLTYWPTSLSNDTLQIITA